MAREGAVCCRREPFVTRPEGLKGLWEIETGPEKRKWRAGDKHGEDGRDWMPIDENGVVIRAPLLGEAELREADAAELALKRAKRIAVRADLGKVIGAMTDDDRAESRAVVEDYLTGRGIDPRWLPGYTEEHGLPLEMEPWKFSRRAAKWWPWSGGQKEAPREDHKPRSRMPALMAPVWALWSGAEAWEQFAGVHATCLVQTGAGRWVKRPKHDEKGKHQPQRIMHADCGGVVILPGVDQWRKRPVAERFPGGVLIIGEGVETTRAGQAAVHMALGGNEGSLAGPTAWAALDAGNLLEVRLPKDVRESGAVHTIIVLGDLDKPLDTRGRPSKTGQIKAAKAVLELRRLYPEITVVARWPMSEWFPKLVQKAEAGEDDRKGVRKGWIARFWEACGYQDSSARKHEEVPADVQSGCDWDDVLQLAGDPVVVGRAILEGLDLDANAERLRAGGPVGQRDHENEGETQGSGDALMPPADQRVDEGAGFVHQDVYEDGHDGGASGASGGGGQPPDFWGMLNWWHEKDDENRPKRPVVAKDVVVRARLFLLMRAWRKGDRRWRLIYWAGKWWAWDRGAVKELLEVDLRHRVAVWLRNLFELRPKGGKGEFQRINPGRSTVADIIEKIAGECSVEVDAMPVWLQATLSENGRPYWVGGIEVPERLGVREDGRGRADGWFVDEAGMFPLQEIVDVRRGKRATIERRAHSAELFTAWRRPYVLDLDELVGAVRDPLGWTAERDRRLMPLFAGALAGMTETIEPGLAKERKLQLGMMIGESNGGGRAMEHVNLLGGPTRSGKTLIENVITAVHGQPPITAATSFTALGSGFGLADLVGKPLVLISDGEIGRYTDTGVATEMLKTISGNGLVRMEPKYGDAVTVRLNARIWIFLNSDPSKLQDSSGALSGRWCAWPMNVSFYGEEDTTLKERVVKEAPGIAVWAMYHYALLFAMDRPRIPQGELSREVLSNLLTQQAPIWAFIVECLQTEANAYSPAGCVVTVAAEDQAVPFDDLYNVYRNFCEINEKPVAGKSKFSANIRAHAPWVRDRQLVRHGRKGSLVGIALRADLGPEFFREKSKGQQTWGPRADNPNVFTMPV